MESQLQTISTSVSLDDMSEMILYFSETAKFVNFIIIRQDVQNIGMQVLSQEIWKEFKDRKVISPDPSKKTIN